MSKRIYKIIALILVIAAVVAVFACCRKEGPKGDTGEQGIQGIQGEKGDKGDTGAQGLKDDKGDKGDDGDDGKNGADGQTPYIKDGYWWIGDTNTKVKASGIKGPQGDDGADGETPYIKDGYWWIGNTNTNVKAEGSDGAQGEKGDKGADGLTPYVKDGYWWIGDTNTNIKAEGPQGEKGEQGETGANGLTPFIKDGYWWIGNTNTGVKAEGSQGEQGEQGEKGETGDNGLSAYELYKKQHPEYTGTEAEWVEAMANGQLTVYTVKFDLNGGTAATGFEPTLMVHYNSTIKLTVPKKQGHTFAGWYTGNNVTDGIFTETDKVTSDMNLIARWIPVKVTITFEDYYGDKISVQTVDYGAKVTPPAVPSRIGKMKFVGWNKSVELNSVTSDMTVKAIYVTDTYTVKFETDGGTAIPDEGVYTGEIPTKPADPVKSGFSFAGWFLDRTYQNEYKFDRALNADTTLYAKYNGDYITITTAAELVAIANDPTAKYMLGNDINLKGDMWTPIDEFSGVLDGAGHKIFNFVITESHQYVGFIRQNSGTIQNLTFDDFMFSSSRTNPDSTSYVGVIAAYNSGIIKDCVLKNATLETASNGNSSTRSDYDIGTVCGYNSSTGIVKNTRSYITMNGALVCSNSTYYEPSNCCYYAGIVGINAGTVDACLYEGSITAAPNRYKPLYNNLYIYVSGLVGKQESTGKITGCEVNADINIKSVNNNNYINDQSVGSLCAENYGKISDCKATGTIAVDSNNQTNRIGGIVGRNRDSAVVSNCYSSVNITVISGSANNYVGGIIGFNDPNASVKMSVYTGSITAKAAAGYGYIMGYMSDGSNCFKCYYSTTSTMTIGEVIMTTGTVNEGTAKLLDEIHSTALLSDTLYWDSDLWIISDGKAPELKAFD